jgi:hypothetical protein
VLLKMHGRDKQWLLIKSRDEFADDGWKLETILRADETGAPARRKTRRTAETKSGGGAKGTKGMKSKKGGKSTKR